MAAKFIPKVKRRSNNQPKDEFFVHDNHIVTVKKFREKIEQMYQVQLRYEKKADDGQWLVLEGEPVDRRNAKNYIMALCHPNEVKQVQFPSAAWSRFDDPDALENIEKKTNAIIRPLSDVAKFELSGTELAVTLAMSLMEELIGSIKGNDNDSVDESNMDFITISPANRNASDRLSDVLQRALSEHSDGICSVQDYSHAPDSVKRVLVNCLQDTEEFDNIDDDMLFSDDREEEGGNASGTDFKETENPPEVGALAEKFTEASISTSNDSSSALASKQIEYLHSFGLSIGYSEDEVKKALDFVDEKTRPSDFLDFLGSIKENNQDKSDFEAELESASDDDVVILETETIEVDDNGIKSKVVVKNDDAANKQARKDSIKANLPEGYKERLLQDFFQEDDNCSVEELKRRNAERQKLLKQNFQQNKTKPDTEEKQQTQGTGKRKGKQNKKKKQTKNQNQPQNSKVESNDLPHDKQLKLDVCENRNSSKDEEQTCVLRIWNNGQEPICPAPAVGGFNPDPITVTPKRKQADWKQVGPKAGGPNHKPMDQNPWQQAGRGGGQRFDGSPNRGQCRKPTQVVAPVNVAAVKQQPTFLQAVNPDELRYIVIDGSNVAMTHSNGKCFSCKGLRICVDYFKQRGHQKITVFVPQWRTCQPSQENQILDQNILFDLKNEDILVFTPSRRIRRKLVAAYDDRFVLELAEAEDGIIVSNDQYRDLMYEKANWRRLIEERLLMFSFVGDRFMPPADPLGRDGPTLDLFLRKQPAYQTQAQPRPQYWPNQYQGDQRQGFQRNKGQGQFQNPRDSGYPGNPNFNKQGHSHQSQQYRSPVPQQFYQGHQFDETDSSQNTGQQHKIVFGPQRGQGQGYGNFPVKGQGHKFIRTEEETENLFGELRIIFPEADQEEHVRNVLANHQAEKDINKLTNYCMSVLF